VVAEGGIGAGGGSLATVVGSRTGGRCGSTVGVAADVWTTDVLIVAGMTATGCAVEVVIDREIAGDIVVDGGLESLGVTISCARWAGCSTTITVATATAIVASTTPMRTIRLDHRPSSSSLCSGAPAVMSSPLPAESSTSSGANR
jgi:hypothetical protein